MTLLNHAASSAALVAIILVPAAGHAQDNLPDLVITANRTAEPLSQIGSAISVVDQQTLSTTNPGSLTDALRSVSGVDVSESGGAGGTSGVRMRGGNTGQTLVMIDGIRINDPTAASGDYDFAMFTPSAIARIEVLKGPQSALYGSDAIGGVINFITKQGTGKPVATLRTEAGSYGTVMTTGSLTGTQGPWNYAFTGGGAHSNGFSRYGYRIPTIEAKFPNLENDGYDRLGGSARIGYDAGEGARFDLSILSSFVRSAYDQSSGTFPDTPSTSSKQFQQISGRATFDTWDGRLTHSINVFASHVDRSFNDVTYKTNTQLKNTTSVISDYVGDSIGAEYQGTLRMGKAGTMIFGSRTQHETGNTYSTAVLPIPGGRTSTFSGSQETNSVFALWQLPIGERLNITLGGRSDEVADVARFETWRATAAYAIPETGTKLRASAGTGAKAPTLYQLYAPTNGNSGLSPEESIGYDAGIDQSLFGGRLTFSLTGYANSFNNMISFDSASLRYFNVARAETSGIEFESNLDIIPGTARLKTTYTWLNATDLATGLTLQRRPEHVGRIALAITPTAQWLIEPRVIAVSRRYSGNNETSPLDPYVRVDLYSEYKIDANWKVFARGENIFDVRYQEILNYGTTGAAAYAGLNVTW